MEVERLIAQKTKALGRRHAGCGPSPTPLPAPRPPPFCVCASLLAHALACAPVVQEPSPLSFP